MPFLIGLVALIFFSNGYGFLAFLLFLLALIVGAVSSFEDDISIDKPQQKPKVEVRTKIIERVVYRSKLTPEEAYHVLGVTPGASKDTIKAAHRQLMGRVHPDHGGSNWLAVKVNEARDLLLK